MILCGEPMAKMFESLRLKVERSEPGNLLQYIPINTFEQVFQSTGSNNKMAIMWESTYKQLRGIAMGKKKGGKKC